jgi:autotransporter-associated beta strand protein
VQLDSTAGNITLNGILSGNGGLIKTGTGTLTLGSINSYKGTTTVNNGTLALGSTGQLTLNSPVYVAQGAQYAVTIGAGNAVNLYSQLTSEDEDAVELPAAVLDGEMVEMLGSTATMAWRVRTGDETSHLSSDVFTITSTLGSSDLPLYVLGMQYDDSQVADSEVSLGWYDADSEWVNAVDGNTGNNASGDQLGYQGSFAAFKIAYGTSLTDYVGAYGYDTAANQAWAVLNHASDFSVISAVPEPCTLALLTAGLFGCIAGHRRKL